LDWFLEGKEKEGMEEEILHPLLLVSSVESGPGYIALGVGALEGGTWLLY